MAMNRTMRHVERRGFALLVAVIFMAVMLTFGLTLSSLAYKQQVLASAATESQYAFYSADAALECTLYADQQQGLFAFNLFSAPPAFPCAGAGPISSTGTHTANLWTIQYRFSLDSGAHCADVSVYKYASPQPDGKTTYLFSQAYDVSCGSVGSTRYVSRGLEAKY